MKNSFICGSFFILKRALVVYISVCAYMLWSLLLPHPHPVSAAVPCPQKPVKPLGPPSGAVLSRQGVYTVCGSLHPGLPFQIIPVRARVAYPLPPGKREGLRKWVHGILVPVRRFLLGRRGLPSHILREKLRRLLQYFQQRLALGRPLSGLLLNPPPATLPHWRGGLLRRPFLILPGLLRYRRSQHYLRPCPLHQLFPACKAARKQHRPVFYRHCPHRYKGRPSSPAGISLAVEQPQLPRPAVLYRRAGPVSIYLKQCLARPARHNHEPLHTHAPRVQYFYWY